VLDASESLGHPIRRALERFGLELFQCPSAADSIPLPLIPPQELEEHAETDVATDQFGAFALLELLKSADSFEPTESVGALGLRQPLAALTAAVRYAETWQCVDAPRGDPRQLDAARAWAEVDPSMLAQLEWLLVARERGDAVEEARARLAVAAHLGPKEAESLRISAQQRSFLAGESPSTLLPSISAAARFANLEISLPGCDPRRRATAIEEAANLLGPSSALLMQANLGFNWMACGDYERASSCFEALVEARPSFIPAWLGLRAVADLTRDSAKTAEACAALGDLLSNPRQASEQWERAATLLLDVMGDTQRGKLALSRAVALDITQGSAFSRLFRLVRETGDADELLRLIEARLPMATDDEERIFLLWERARALRTRGDRAGALLALDGVTRLSPNHVGALALAGEIHIALGQFDDAARFLAQLSSLTDAPLKQRIMSALAAADLFDKKLGRSNFARDILLDLYRTQATPPALRERLAQIAIKIEVFPLAVEVLESLLGDLQEQEARIDTARLVLALCRDKLGQPARAERAVELLLEHLPTDPEAIDLVLTSCFSEDRTDFWLMEARDRLREDLGRDPLDAPLLERLAKIAHYFDDVRTRQACLGALIAISAGTPEYDLELSSLAERIEPVPNIAIDEIALELLADPQDQGPIAELFARFAIVFVDALGPSLAALGVGKKQRVDPRLGLPLRNEIAAWAGAFGVPDFDLYLTERVDGDVTAIATERPSLVVSASLVTPLDLRGRQAVARELFALRRGTTLLRHRSPHEIAALIVAACQVGETPIAAPPYAMKDEFSRLVGSAMPRKLRKSFAEHTRAIQEANPDLGDWVRAATHSLDRVGVLACGDASQVLAHLTGQRGRLGTSRELQERTARLVAFAVSTSYLELKDTFGLTVR
jgi:tetratricopeptide (TPR) repeat protein